MATDLEIERVWVAVQPHVRLVQRDRNLNPMWLQEVLGRQVFKEESWVISRRLHEIYQTIQRLSA